MTENIGYIHRGNPVRTLLDSAAQGQVLTQETLDQLLIDTSREHLPDGESFNQFRGQIVAQAKIISQLHNKGYHQDAANQAQEAASTIAQLMTPAQRALKTTSTKAQEQAVDDAVTRAFQN